MKQKDILIKSELEEILQNDFSGEHLKLYFENLPDNKIRRALTILTAIYPDKTAVPENEFDFILYMFSRKFIEQNNFFEFIRALNIIDFTEDQKEKLIDVIKEHIAIFCNTCTFELDDLMVKLFEKTDLFYYLKSLAKDEDRAVLEHILDILRYENFFDTKISYLSLEELKQEVFRKLNYKKTPQGIS